MAQDRQVSGRGNWTTVTLYIQVFARCDGNHAVGVQGPGHLWTFKRRYG